MFEIDPIKLHEKLSLRWHNKSYLLFTIIIVIASYLLLIRYFATEPILSFKLHFQNFIPIIYIIIPGFLIVLIASIWLFTTNRFFLKLTNNKIIAGVILKIDEEIDQLVISKIIKKTINNINKSGKFPNVIIKFLPPNHCTSANELNKYHKKFGFLYDLIISIGVDSGSYNSIEKIIISNLTLTFKPKSSLTKKRIFFDIVDILEDMSLQASSKDWVYDYNNNGPDKIKYLENLYEIFLFYIGLYSIYLDRYEDALKIISQIFDQKKLFIPISKDKSNRMIMHLKLSHLAQGRMATILVDLFFSLAVKSYYNQNTVKALSYLEKLKNLLEKHPKRFNMYIDMARYSYELGNLDQAVLYTKEAQKFNNNGVEIYLNNGFFAILEDDIEKYLTNFKKIFTDHLNNNLNWVDIYVFQGNELSKMPDKELYFRFSMSTIDFLFINNLNLSQYKEIVDSYKDLEKFDKLYELGNLIINNYIKKANRIKNRLFTKPKNNKRKINKR